MASVCGECGADELGPVLRDETWLKLAEKDETLCFGCMLQRAEHRHVDLDYADLLPCGFNLFDHPRSWFGLFRRSNPEAPISDEWRDAASPFWKIRENIEDACGADVVPFNPRLVVVSIAKLGDQTADAEVDSQRRTTRPRNGQGPR